MIRQARYRGLALAAFGLLLGCAACSRKAAQEAPAAREPEKTAPKVLAPPAPPSLLDEKGQLKPSGRFLNWLELPMGFEETELSHPRHHVFDARGVTLQQARDYLSQRMLTGRVLENPTRVAYSGVIPVDSRPDAMRFDVRIDELDTKNGVRLTVDELSFLNSKPLSADEAQRVLTKERTVAE